MMNGRYGAEDIQYLSEHKLHVHVDRFVSALLAIKPKDPGLLFEKLHGDLHKQVRALVGLLASSGVSGGWCLRMPQVRFGLAVRGPSRRVSLCFLAFTLFQPPISSFEGRMVGRANPLGACVGCLRPASSSRLPPMPLWVYCRGRAPRVGVGPTPSSARL